MSDYTIHKLKNTEFSLLVPLMKNCFGMNVNINFFEWKFKHNPSGFVEGYYAKAGDGEVAAYYGAIPETYIIEGEKRIIYQSCDTMTHSNHRRKGLFQKLAVHCYEELKNENKLFLIGFGGGQSTPGFLKFGWKKVFDTKYYFYPRIFNLFTSGKFKNISRISDYSTIEHLTIQSNKRSLIHSYKSAKIYSWRVSNPLQEYQTFAVKDDQGAYNSYVTYYVEADKIVLFDFYIQNIKLGDQLLNYLKSLLTRKHKGIVSLMQENSEFSKKIRKYNFISNPFKKGPLSEKTPFIFYANEGDLVKYNNKLSWEINSFDHDSA